MTDKELVQRIKDALGTEEDGEALIEVARNACRAEQELATCIKKIWEHDNIETLRQAIDN